MRQTPNHRRTARASVSPEYQRHPQTIERARTRAGMERAREAADRVGAREVDLEEMRKIYERPGTGSKGV